jgi:hypothetical protein
VNNPDQFDQILDDALSHYREAEPLARLEDRVLERVRLHDKRHQRLWWRWSAVAAAAAILAMAAWVRLSDRAWHGVAPSTWALRQTPPVELPSRLPEIGATNEPPPAVRTPVAKAVGSGRPHRSAPPPPVSAERFAMREQFPSPVPLKPEERGLMALAQRHPEILAYRTGDDREIVIAPIDIQPLAESGEDKGEN